MEFHHKLALAVGTGAFALAALVVTRFEGYQPVAYLDPPGIPTICYGHTKGVEQGQTLTPAECNALLKGDLGQAFAAVDRYVTVPLSETRRAALASFVYNVGEAQFARSTLLRRLNAGEGARVCAELSRWVISQGQVLPGLVKRRAIERQLCEGRLL
jgi:lysozyme